MIPAGMHSLARRARIDDNCTRESAGGLKGEHRSRRPFDSVSIAEIGRLAGVRSGLRNPLREWSYVRPAFPSIG